ncbi:hypothetical protein ACQ4LE_001705 [Meloidogyne hapla]
MITDIELNEPKNEKEVTEVKMINNEKEINKTETSTLAISHAKSEKDDELEFYWKLARVICDWDAKNQRDEEK